MEPMLRGMITQLQEQLEEAKAEVKWEKERTLIRERELQDPENIFLLFDKAKLTAADLSKRRIKCGWCDPGRGPVCGVPATEVLPRPAIFVCDAHLQLWNTKVDEANAENGGLVHKKRVTVAVAE